jgi:hypothetical protein
MPSQQVRPESVFPRSLDCQRATLRCAQVIVGQEYAVYNSAKDLCVNNLLQLSLDASVLCHGLWRDVEGEVAQLSNPNKLKGSRMQVRRCNLRQTVMLQEDYVLHEK